MTPKRHADEVDVDEDLVRRLLRAQLPQWADLPLEIVEPSGTDHTIYRLGDDMVVRMPIIKWATAQAEKEAWTVPFLAPQVPLELPTPLAMGQPGEGYPFKWSVVAWIDGERAGADTLDLSRAAVDLAGFITALQSCDPTDGPPAGPGTGNRGLSIRAWDPRVRTAVAELEGFYDMTAAVAAWEEVLDTPEWELPPVWFHGDLGGNLIARDRRLVGAIDSGYGVGDPACDLQPGWALFRGEDRATFFDAVGLDDATRIRARGWSLAPGFIGLSYYRDVPHLFVSSRGAIEGALAD
jgi:aminoglycoside phosphotransferase (APT) family kinase protein